MRKNLAAYTQTNYVGYPGYYSLNEEDSGAVSLTVRTPGGMGTQVATLPLPEDEALKLADAIYAKFKK